MIAGGVRAFFAVDPAEPSPGGDAALLPELRAALDDLRARVRRGAGADPLALPPSAWIRGPRGAGKSTLLRQLGLALEQGSEGPGGAAPLVVAVDLSAADRRGAAAAIAAQAARRLGVALDPRVAASEQDAAAAIHAALRGLPGRVLILLIDDLGPRTEGDAAAQRQVQALLVHLARRLRGRAFVVGVGEDLPPEGMRACFPAERCVALSPALARSLVEMRLLRKTPEGEAALRALLQERRAGRARGDAPASVDDDALVASYPLLPGAWDPLLRLSTALADASLDGGLEGLLAALFRSGWLDRAERGQLAPLDAFYELARPALDPEVSAVVDGAPAGLPARAARAVALLEAAGSEAPIAAGDVARNLQDHLGRDVDERSAGGALAALEEAGVLWHLPRLGYRLRTAAVNAWERRRAAIEVTFEERSELIREKLLDLLGEFVPIPAGGRRVGVTVSYSDGKRQHDNPIAAPTSLPPPAAAAAPARPPPRGDASIRLDLRFLPARRRSDAEWRDRSGRLPLLGRLLWVAAGDPEIAQVLAAETLRSRVLLRGDGAAAAPAVARLLVAERARGEALEARMRDAVEDAFLAGSFYFRGEPTPARALGDGFGAALAGAVARVRPFTFFEGGAPADPGEPKVAGEAGATARAPLAELAVAGRELGSRTELRALLTELEVHIGSHLDQGTRVRLR
ncbi:hypothetical protein [Sorangium sp. So ce861]|uniref:hypothetical protein n=1 Tax=Sorangium sp. So ce861 TaxID=3133323 RepID=UPI003F6077BB